MQDSFKKLLESVRSTNPDLISEEAAAGMLEQYESGINQIKSDALAEGQALGFKDGYDEGKKVAAEESKKALDALVEQLDQEATEKLKACLDLLNDQHAEKLQAVYDMLKENYIPKAEYEKLDSDCADKLKEVYDTVCAKAQADQTAAVNEVTEQCKVKMESREAFHNKKEKALKLLLESKLETAEKALKEEQSRKLDILSEQVEKYLNYALEEKIPTKQLISEQKYHASLKTIEKITDILKINNILQESKDGIFTDYENKIKEQKEESNRLLLENANLKSKLNKQEAKLLLEEKIRKCVPGEANFLRSYFKNAESSKLIEEQIDEAKAVYKRLYDEKHRKLVSESSKTVSAKPSTVVTEKKESVNAKESSSKKVVTEEVTSEKPQENGYNKGTFIQVYSSMLSNNK